MFDNTSESDARELLGGDLYDELRHLFAEELTKSGLSLDTPLADHIQNCECPPLEANKGFKSYVFRDFLRDNLGHKLITLLKRDGYVFNNEFPTVRTNSSREVRKHLPFFGVGIYDKSGLTLDEIKYSSVVIAGMQFSSEKLKAQLMEFAEFRQTFPQMDKNRNNISYLYLCAFAGVPNAEAPRLSPQLAQLMGLNQQGDLDFSLWAKGGPSLTDVALKTFLEVKNPNGKDKGALLSNRYEVMDTNLACLTVLPAQILFLRGHPLDDIMQGLMNRVQAIAAHTLGEYPEFDSYVEYAIKRPFIALPECWPELGITSSDFLGRTFDEPELSDIFRSTPFRNGLGHAFHWDNFYVTLPSILKGLNREGADFFNPAYLRHYGFSSACRTDFTQINEDALKSLFETATELKLGSPMLLKPYKGGTRTSDPLESTLVPICNKIGAESFAKHMFSLFNAKGEKVQGVDGFYIEDKKGLARKLSEHLPEVFSRLFELIMDEKKPKKTLVEIMIPFGRPPREHFKKLSGSQKEEVFSGDLGL